MVIQFETVKKKLQKSVSICNENNGKGHINDDDDDDDDVVDENYHRNYSKKKLFLNNLPTCLSYHPQTGLKA